MAGAAAVVAVSRALGAQARVLSPRIGRLETIHNGYTPAHSTLLERDELNNRLGWRLPSEFAVLVGNCRRYKGPDIALQAWAQLAAEGSRLSLLIVGGGPDLDAMRALCNELDLDDRVHFTGPRSRHVATSLTALATLQVAPSRNEGQGIVILEAGYYGTPVICSDIPPFLEMVDAGTDAAVFPAGNAGALAQQVEAFLADREAARATAQHLRARVQEEFTCAAMVRRYLDLYRSVLD